MVTSLALALQDNPARAVEAALALRDDLDDETKERIRAGVVQAARDRRRAPRPLTKADRADFLALLRAGLGVQDSADMLGRAISVLYGARHAEPEFSKAWVEALEAGCEPVERRLQAIALTGSAESMATVRAAEVLLKTRHRAHQQAKPQPLSATVDGPNGGSLTIRLGGQFGD